MDTSKPDYSKLPEDLKAKLLKWEANNPANKQVQLLSDIADLTQEMLGAMDDERKGNNKAIEHFGSLLVDMREQLTALNAKEAPETPDNSKPVIDAISKLEKALTAQKAPVVNVAKADAPVVNVDAPNVTIDNKEISKILKTDLPKAFNQAISGIVIPKTDNTETNQLLEQVAEQLASIDTGVRMKPQSPTTMGITGVTVVNGKIPVDVDMATEGIASEAEQITQSEILEEIEHAVQAIASARGVASDLRVTLLGSTAAIGNISAVTTVTTVTGITNIGGIPAVQLVPSNQNMAAVQSNINNVIVS